MADSTSPTSDTKNQPVTQTGLDSMTEQDRLSLEAAGKQIQLSIHTPVFQAGDPVNHYLFVLQGSVRVYRTTVHGREIDLYRVNQGQSCVLTTSCLMAGERYPADGITESEVSALLVPKHAFNQLMADSSSFQSFVFSAFGQRLSDLMILVENLAYGRIDTRLAHCLLQHSDNNSEIHKTHQELAIELGTAREVISRQLKTFEQNGLIKLARGSITIIDRQRLI